MQENFHYYSFNICLDEDFCFFRRPDTIPKVIKYSLHNIFTILSN